MFFLGEGKGVEGKEKGVEGKINSYFSFRYFCLFVNLLLKLKIKKILEQNINIGEVKKINLT